VEETLHQAERLEKEYDWLGAAESYEKALKLLPEDDFSRKAEIYERLGHAFYRFAFQAESNNEFKERLRQAIADYERAKEHYQKLNDPKKTGIILRCDAMNAYLGYWLALEVPEKKRLLADCWRSTKETLCVFQEAGEAWEYGRTYNQLSSSLVFNFSLEWDFKSREKMIKDAIELGEQTIKSLSNLKEPSELARAYARTAFFLGVFDYYFLDTKKDIERAKNYWLKAKDLSEDIALFELLYPIFGPQFLLWGEATDEVFDLLEKALDRGRKAKDKFIIGEALDWLTYNKGWAGARVEDPEEGKSLFDSVLRYANDAIREYSVISFVSPRGDAYAVETNQSASYAAPAYYETDLKKKRSLYEKAREAARNELRLAESSAYPELLVMMHHWYGAMLFRSALVEPNSEEKRVRLEEALEHRKEAARITEQLEPFLYWNRGIMQQTIANTKSLLAELMEDPQAKRNMLQEAVNDHENGTRLCIKGFSTLPYSDVYFFPLGLGEYTNGVLLTRLHEVTRNKENLRNAIEAFNKAIELYGKIDQRSLVAECYWKSGQAFDVLDEHLKAAEDFAFASTNYQKAVEKTPQLRALYQDHAFYMQAWSEIEKAKYHHEKQEYGPAKERFEKAASLHKSLKRWNYLAPNYAAWAQVENAEHLSRGEQGENAVRAFEQAANLFTETKNSLQEQLNKIEDQDEKQMANNMLRATDIRHEYCKARIAVEEAKILDKKGDHYSSSEKYRSAIQTFRRISQELETEQEQREAKYLITLTQAWERMTSAEAESSPAVYQEASQLFEQAKDLSPNERTKMLVLGHSRFCRALEAGTRFADTRDTAMHALATQHLASASNYYIKADFQNASEYAKATKLLFDAYLQMDNAEKENDPERKAKLYTMAEKVLQTSAGSYTKAEHPEKMEQVMKLIEKVKEERELATSLTEVLHAPPIISTTTAFTSPTPTREEAVGLEKFENASIQASVTARQKELKIGENLNLILELVNAGKTPALLIKVAEVVPEGFELAEKPDTYVVEDSCLNMKGKRLGALKTEEIRLVLKPKAQGTFTLKPRIMYLDENGKYKTHEPEPVTIIIKELGIKGWLKGER
jgi:tetratricopeptide (TPR) repeat protein